MSEVWDFTRIHNAIPINIIYWLYTKNDHVRSFSILNISKYD